MVRGRWRPTRFPAGTLVHRLARLLPAAIVPPLALALALGDRPVRLHLVPGRIAIVAAFVLFSTTGPRRALSRVQVVALSCAAALAGWMYLSLLWSELGGPTLTEANRAATYALALSLVVLVGDTPERRRDLLLVTAGVSGLLALYIGVHLMATPSLELFQADRLFRPIGYPNVLAAFLMMGLWPLDHAGRLAGGAAGRPRAVADGRRCDSVGRAADRVAGRRAVRGAGRRRLLRLLADPGAVAAGGGDRVRAPPGGLPDARRRPARRDGLDHGVRRPRDRVRRDRRPRRGRRLGAGRAPDPVPVDDRASAPRDPRRRPRDRRHRRRGGGDRPGRGGLRRPSLAGVQGGTGLRRGRVVEPPSHLGLEPLRLLARFRRRR